jgi:hypothetical protein
LPLQKLIVFQVRPILAELQSTYNRDGESNRKEHHPPHAQFGGAVGDREEVKEKRLDHQSNENRTLRVLYEALEHA